MKFRLYRFFYWVALHWWIWWSRRYQNRHQKRVICNYPVKCGVVTPEVAQSEMAKIKWVKDGPKELWDAISHPAWFQYLLVTLRRFDRQEPGSVDCEDYAFWAATVVMDMYHPVVVAVGWLAADNKIEGHSVCACRANGKWFHIGNWGKSESFFSLTEVAMDVYTRGNGAKLIGWATLSKNMELLQVNKSFEEVT